MFGRKSKSAPIMERSRALYAYEAADENELSFQEGDILVIVAKNEEGWYEATNSDGKTGFVPSSYIESLQTGKAIYDYEQKESGEISLTEGETVLVYTQDESGWWEGENSKGQIGYFPASYLELVENSKAKANDRKSKRFSYASGFSRSVVSQVPSVESKYDISNTNQWKSKPKNFTVSVGAPETVGSGIMKYTSYEITTNPGSGKVGRRYRDFLWLKQQLSEKYPALAMPSLPKKQYQGRFDEQFVERRRRSLERFLNRVSKHPVLSNSEILKGFLFEKSSDRFDSLKKSSAKDKEKGDFFFSVVGADHSLEAGNIEKFSGYLEGYLENVRLIKQLAKQLVARHLEEGVFVQKFGSLMTLWHDVPGHGPCWKKMCTKCTGSATALHDMEIITQKMNNLYKVQAEREVSVLQEAVKQYSGLSKSIIASIELYNKTTAQVKVAEENYQKAERSGIDTSSTSARWETLKERQDKIAYVLCAEMEFFHDQLLIDFQSILDEFTSLEAKFHTDIANLWSSFSKPIGNMGQDIGAGNR